jgi:hypothetical protein
MTELVAAALVTCSLWTTGTTIQVLDESGAPFGNVLVIVKSLQDGRELARDLTDGAGRCPAVRLGPGLYRVIAACPYGLCQTTVTEVLGERLTGVLTLQVPMKPLDGQGVVVGARETVITVLSNESKPLSDVALLIRNFDATWERWSITDARGTVKVALGNEPAVALIVRETRVLRYLLAARCDPGTAGAGAGYVSCERTGSGRVALTIPQE